MARVIVVIGYGPGISRAVAERFGAEGYAVALVGRTAERLEAGVAALAAKGITAAATVGDASDPASVSAAIARARAALGPVTAVHWNAYGAGEAGDILTLDPAAAAASLFAIPVAGLLAAVREALPDLKASGEGSVLVTNGAYGDDAPAMDALAVRTGAMGLAVGNAAKRKLVGLLAERLRDEGVFVGEVNVAGGVRGTAWAGEGGIDPAVIADRFWSLHRARGETRARVV